MRIHIVIFKPPRFSVQEVSVTKIATSRAVQKWQSAHGIAITTTGVGVVGPKTRTAMACNGTY